MIRIVRWRAFPCGSEPLGKRDRHVGQAIALIYACPAQALSVEELGRKIGMSRSVLHERFVELTGQSPMQHLTNWRMQLDAGLLRRGHIKVAAVAQEVGL